MAEKRRLPLIDAGSHGASRGDDAGDARPPWHWIGFGTVAIFVVWLPLAFVAELVRRRATEAMLGAPETPEEAARAIAQLGAGERARLAVAMIATHGAALALAAFAGGMLVGRFGGDKIGAREAALAGLMAALIAVALSWSGWSWAPLAVAAIATLGAYAGGAAGARRRQAQAR